jgi:hypothetical protein
MLKIFMPLADGEEIKPEVLEGIIKNNCSLYPFTSELKEHRRINMVNNWNRAFELNKEEIFIGMDSDVILEDGIIEELLKNLEGYDMVTAPTKERHKQGQLIPPHSVFCTRLKLKFPPITERCPICDTIKKLKINTLWEFPQHEI